MKEEVKIEVMKYTQKIKKTNKQMKETIKRKKITTGRQNEENNNQLSILVNKITNTKTTQKQRRKKLIREYMHQRDAQTKENDFYDTLTKRKEKHKIKLNMPSKKLIYKEQLAFLDDSSDSDSDVNDTVISPLPGRFETQKQWEEATITTRSEKSPTQMVKNLNQADVIVNKIKKRLVHKKKA
mmetsp:Transcript_364/g.658  ORF Transcript_364/g.658 Transcript_364/m.658 type:complete len:183 (-) Transcript_364:944-1492(-)